MPTLRESLLELSHDTEVTMFELSGYNKANPAETFYFSNFEGVVFNNVTYLPISCELTGIQYSGEGSPPRPRLKVSDADPAGNKIISSMIYFFGGLEGATLVIRKTLYKYLDGRTEADPTQEKPRDIFTISHKIQEVPGKFVEFELSAPIDFVDEVIPARPCIRNCPYVYRNSTTGCTYTSTKMFTILNRPTQDKKKDVCAKSVEACQKRFGFAAPLPFGGFPGLNRV